jgi:hypothetical protein
LREAVTRANDEATNPGSDTIQISATGVISLETALPMIVSDLVVNGPGAASLTVRRSAVAPPFRVFVTDNDKDLEMRDLTVSDGLSTGLATQFGAGIVGGGAVTLERVVVRDNRVVSTDPDPAFAAGVSAEDELIMRDTVIADNHLQGDGTSSGAGFYAVGGDPITIERSTIADNTGGPAGGTQSSSTKITDSTVSGNSHGIRSFAAETKVTSSTIVDNGAFNLFAVNAPTQFTLRNSIVAGATGPNCGGTGSFLSAGHNIADDAECSLAGVGDKPNTDPLLLPLAANGGPTPTHALAPASPARDAGAANGSVADQRGLPRPYDDPAIPNAVGGDGADIGSLEVQPPPPQVTASAKKKQKLTKAVKVNVSCALACSLEATSLLKGKGVKNRSLVAPGAQLGAGESKTLKLKASKETKRRLKALKRKGKKAKLTVNVVATDAVGQAGSAAPLKITLR